MFHHHNVYTFKKIIDDFILSSSDNESIKDILRNIDFEAFKLGISFYQMIFILIRKNAIHNRKSWIQDKWQNIKETFFYIFLISF
jgi:hypothetical protein